MAGPPPGAGLAADDDQPPAHGRVLVGEQPERLDHHLRALERLDPAGEHDHRVLQVDPLVAAWPAASSPGVKTSVSTPGGTTSIRAGSAP